MQQESSSNYFISVLESLSENSLKRPLTLQEILDSFGFKSHSLLISFLSLPFLQPIPLIGLSTPLGIMIIIVAFFQIIQRKPWVPKRWQKKVVSSQILEKTSHLAQKYLKRMSSVISRRWLIFFNSYFIRIFNFIVVSTLAILLSLPLPIPFSNTIPALGIFINGIGQLEEDGVLIGISYVVFLIALVFFSGIGVGAAAGANSLLN